MCGTSGRFWQVPETLRYGTSSEWKYNRKSFTARVKSAFGQLLIPGITSDGCKPPKDPCGLLHATHRDSYCVERRCHVQWCLKPWETFVIGPETFRRRHQQLLLFGMLGSLLVINFSSSYYSCSTVSSENVPCDILDLKSRHASKFQASKQMVPFQTSWSLRTSVPSLTRAQACKASEQ